MSDTRAATDEEVRTEKPGEVGCQGLGVGSSRRSDMATREGAEGTKGGKIGN